MKILISADIHANILAAEKAVNLSKFLGCDLHIHLGDAVDLGPWPEETIQLLSSEKVILLKGNHEEYHCSSGFGPVIEMRMVEEERDHYKWTNDQLSADSIDLIEKLNYSFLFEESKFYFHFQHFPIINNRIAEEWVDVSAPSFTKAFGDSGDVQFFGHVHRVYDIIAGSRFVCPGAAGVVPHPESGMKVVCLEISDNSYSLKSYNLDWNIKKLRNHILTANNVNSKWLLENMYNE